MKSVRCKNIIKNKMSGVELQIDDIETEHKKKIEYLLGIIDSNEFEYYSIQKIDSDTKIKLIINNNQETSIYVNPKIIKLFPVICNMCDYINSSIESDNEIPIYYNEANIDMIMNREELILFIKYTVLINLLYFNNLEYNFSMNEKALQLPNNLDIELFLTLFPIFNKDKIFKDENPIKDKDILYLCKLLYLYDFIEYLPGKVTIINFFGYLLANGKIQYYDLPYDFYTNASTTS